MAQSLRLSVRSALIAGMSTAVVGAMAVTPVASNVASNALASVKTVSPVVQLTAALESLEQPIVDATAYDATAYDVPEPVLYDAGADPVLYTAAPTAASATSGIENFIKNTYDAIEPWVAWGFELAQWAMSFVPGLWWVAPGIDLAYYTIEPLVQAGVYVFADVVGLDFSQIGPDIKSGIQQSWQNFVNYGLAWIGSLVPLPPLPPFPPRPFASLAVESVAASRVAAMAAVAAEVAPVETTVAAPQTPATPAGRNAVRAARAAAAAHAPVPAAAEAAQSQPTDSQPADSQAADPVVTVASPAAPQAPAKVSRGSAARTAHAGKAARTAGRAG